MVALADVRWGKYMGYQGPWHPGRFKYVLPANPTEADRRIAVITATEGGTLDAINRYDKCIDTQGVIQWCNRAPQHSVDKLYALVARKLPAAVDQYNAALDSIGYKFDVASGLHVRNRDAALVNTPALQCELYFDRPDNAAHSPWTEAQQHRAKQFVVWSLKFWESPEARAVQVEYTAARLESFFLYKFSAELFHMVDDSDIGRAFQAVLLSFAASNPLLTCRSSEAAYREAVGHLQPWSLEWLAHFCYYWVFHANIAIYPGRYAKLVPVIQQLYGVQLPVLADLSPSTSSEFASAEEVQAGLIQLGYDLGPAGVDGVFGKKSQRALRRLEEEYAPQRHADGIPDVETVALLHRVLEARGVSALT